MPDLAVLGHIVIDRVITSEGSRTQLGGPPTYVALAAKRLGVGVVAVTKVGDDLPIRFAERLRRLGVVLEGRVVEGAATTRFVLDYRRGERRLSVESVCEELEAGDVGEPPEAVLISPVLGEVTAGAAEAASSSALVALDPQGFVREVGPHGQVRARRWFDAGLLRRVHIYKSSAEELRLVTGREEAWRGLGRIRGLGVEVAMATMGAEGTMLLTGEGRYRVPAYKSNVVDLTGAGDAFIGGFLAERLRGGESAWCAAVGASAAASVVETRGARIELSRRLLRERAEAVYEGVVRL